jgi:HSP20 family protein
LLLFARTDNDDLIKSQRRQRMSLIRWEPLRELVSLREAMDKLLADSFVRPSRLLSAEAVPPLDVYETDKAVVVKSALAGVKPEQVDISITGDVLTIKASLSPEMCSLSREKRRLKRR